MDTNSATVDLETFKHMFPDLDSIRSNMTILVAKADQSSDQIFVFFPERDPNSKSGAVSTKAIKVYTDKMEEEEVTRAILVVNSGVTSFARRALNEMSKIKVELFHDRELLVNITKHVLVPEHEVLTEEGKQAVLDKYRLKEAQLPRILKTDPIARFYGLSQGQVVKIKRDSDTAGRYITYRYVV